MCDKHFAQGLQKAAWIQVIMSGVHKQTWQRRVTSGQAGCAKQQPCLRAVRAALDRQQRRLAPRIGRRRPGPAHSAGVEEAGHL